MPISLNPDQRARCWSPSSRPTSTESSPRTAHGETLSPRAAALAEAIYNSGSLAVDAEQWQRSTELERIRIAWNTQWGGESRWQSWNPDELVGGLGLTSRTLPDGHQARSIATMYSYPGDDDLVRASQEGRAPVVWVEFPLRIGDAAPALAVIVLVKNPAGVWRPMLLTAAGRPRMMF